MMIFLFSILYDAVSDDNIYITMNEIQLCAS